jgi:hypothetical protein
MPDTKVWGKWLMDNMAHPFNPIHTFKPPDGRKFVMPFDLSI